jgi:hypothetical protein
MSDNLQKPESALGFMSSHMKQPEDNELIIEKFKKLQKAEMYRQKIRDAENEKREAKEE